MDSHRNAQGIYVEILMNTTMEELWKHTQVPDLHEQWDLRFTRIEYLPLADPQLPQQFLYATRIGFGMEIQGKGETKGTIDMADGQRTSALRFWSQDPKSLIEEGSGFWKYVPTEAGIRFFTWYTYSTRFGWCGRLFDRIVFRPLMGWATAWSFDRLRLWIERGIRPADAFRQSLIHVLARLSIAFIWFYHGLVPKLLFHDRDELLPLITAGVSPDLAQHLVIAAGCLEIGMAMLFLLAWRQRALFIITVVLMLVALVGVASTSPAYLVRAFNPVTLNTAMIALSVIGFLSSKDIPSARNCMRAPPKGGG